MTDILTRLRALEQPIRVGLIGVGNIGRGMFFQTIITPGVECVAVADLQIERTLQWIESLHQPYCIVETVAEMNTAIRQGKIAVCEDANLIGHCALIDVQADASTSIHGGLTYAQNAIEHHKHVVMMNSEADLIFGPYLLKLAQREGVVYTSADGDQHSVLKRLINETEFMGFKTVLAGNIKGYLDYHSNPTDIIPEAKKRFMDNKMCVSYTDGTKLNIEMALIANGIGAKTIVPGMMGLEVKDINQFPSFFDFDTLWDGDTPIVDYTIKTYPPGGVFVVGYTDHPHQRQTLAWYPPNMGEGPFYVFHRPYHLGHFEYLASVAEAYLDGWAILKPDYGLKTNVYAYAKKDLKKGERLDGIGGYCAYGLIENTIDNQMKSGLPICLAEDVTLKQDIAKDEKIFIGDVNLEQLQHDYSRYDGLLESIIK